MGAYFYILTNRKHGALYAGVTRNIEQRTFQHRDAEGGAFCKRYGIDKLVHAEPYDLVMDAVAREKAVKKWCRAWKIALIEAANPDWRDLWFDLNR